MNTQARSNAARTAPWLAPRLWFAFGVLALGARSPRYAPRPRRRRRRSTSPRPKSCRDRRADRAVSRRPRRYCSSGVDLSAANRASGAVSWRTAKTTRACRPNEDWDDSIVALLNYPEVVKLLNDDLDWTYDLGTAVLNQRADVLSAIQAFRDEAYAAGNLRSDERQTVAREDDTIEIKPADPQVIYVPYYEPERVVVYQPEPVYHYYPHLTRSTTTRIPRTTRFDTGFFWGVQQLVLDRLALASRARLRPVLLRPSVLRPELLQSVLRAATCTSNFNSLSDYVWQPHYRYGGRPVVRGYEGRVYAADHAASRRARRRRRGAHDGRLGAYRTTEGVGRARDADARRTRAPRRRDCRAAASARAIATAARRQRAASGEPRRWRADARRAHRRRTQYSARLRRKRAIRTPATQPRYRSGGGMSQALEPAARRKRSTNRVRRPGAARDEGSTGMPRESSRGARTRSASSPRAAAPREPRIERRRHERRNAAAATAATAAATPAAATPAAATTAAAAIAAAAASVRGTRRRRPLGRALRS